jgi:hypothetical protein
VVVVVVVVVLEDDAEVVGDHEDGGLLCGLVVVGSTVVCSVGVTSTCGLFSGGLACSGWGRTGLDTVMTTVDVLPSGATLTEVVVLTVCSTSALFSGGPAAGLPPVASREASVANTVATTTPPAASSTTEETFFPGDSE